jgi:uncharacterized radical SAM superfamily protein
VEAEILFQQGEVSNQQLSDIAVKYFHKNFENAIKLFYPGLKFSAISLTDNFCQLKCDHCNLKYLEHMKRLSDYTSLFDFAKKMEEKGALGILVSGGCDLEGAVPLDMFLDDLSRIKQETKLVVNVHTGLIKNSSIRELAKTGVDVVSFDVTGDDEVIRSVFHLNKSSKDYRNTFHALKKSGLNIVPHICLGLNKGVIGNEFKALRILEEFNPTLIVIIIFTPTAGTPLQNIKPPSSSSIQRFLSILRLTFPEAELSLGCMRPRGLFKKEIEVAALRSGFNRITSPSSAVKHYAAELNIKVEKFYGCCSLPGSLLSSFKIV